MSTDGNTTASQQTPASLKVLLARSGVDETPFPIHDVPVRPAPTWLTRVWGPATEGMSMPWGIYLRAGAYDRVVEGADARLLVHEAVHIEQWRSRGATGFLARYLSDYLRGRAVGMSHSQAYRRISLEREAEALAQQTVNPS